MVRTPFSKPAVLLSALPPYSKCMASVFGTSGRWALNGKRRVGNLRTALSICGLAFSFDSLVVFRRMQFETVQLVALQLETRESFTLLETEDDVLRFGFDPNERALIVIQRAARRSHAGNSIDSEDNAEESSESTAADGLAGAFGTIIANRGAASGNPAWMVADPLHCFTFESFGSGCSRMLALPRLAFPCRHAKKARARCAAVVAAVAVCSPLNAGAEGSWDAPVVGHSIAFGKPRSFEIFGGSYRWKWVAGCQSLNASSFVGHAYLWTSTGTEYPIDEFVAQSPNGRYAAVIEKGRLVIFDTVDDERLDLTSLGAVSDDASSTESPRTRVAFS